MMTRSVTTTIGARLTMKSMNDRSVAPAMRMFGGSPMSVAVPPMLEAMISMSTSGIGSMSSASASRNVIGTMSSTVVRLSRNAESTAVAPERHERDGERAALGELPGADRQVGVHAGRLGEPDDDHHPGEQAERVPVDRLDRGLLADRLRQQDGDGAEQSDLGPVDPLGGDHGERDDEDGDGSGHAETRADQSSRLTCGDPTHPDGSQLTPESGKPQNAPCVSCGSSR